MGYLEVLIVTGSITDFHLALDAQASGASPIEPGAQPSYDLEPAKVGRFRCVAAALMCAGFLVNTIRSPVVTMLQLVFAAMLPIANRPSVIGEFRSSPVSLLKSSPVM
jgi:hypothetical protein